MRSYAKKYSYLIICKGVPSCVNSFKSQVEFKDGH